MQGQIDFGGPVVMNLSYRNLARAAANFGKVASTFLFLVVISKAQPSRILSSIEPARRSVLTGNRNPRATAANDRGAVSPSVWMGGMALVFRSSEAQQAELSQLLAAQQDPSSPEYHAWLTPEQFADR